MSIYLSALLVASLIYLLVYLQLRKYSATELTGMLFLILLATGPLFIIFGFKLLCFFSRHSDYLEYRLYHKDYNYLYNKIHGYISESKDITDQEKADSVQSYSKSYLK